MSAIIICYHVRRPLGYGDRTQQSVQSKWRELEMVFYCSSQVASKEYHQFAQISRTQTGVDIQGHNNGQIGYCTKNLKVMPTAI